MPILQCIFISQQQTVVLCLHNYVEESCVLCRLRHLLAKLHRDDLEKDDVVKNLEYVIRRLDLAFTEEIRSQTLAIIIIVHPI